MRLTIVQPEKKKGRPKMILMNKKLISLPFDQRSSRISKGKVLRAGTQKIIIKLKRKQAIHNADGEGSRNGFVWK